MWPEIKGLRGRKIVFFTMFWSLWQHCYTSQNFANFWIFQSLTSTACHSTVAFEFAYWQRYFKISLNLWSAASSSFFWAHIYPEYETFIQVSFWKKQFTRHAKIMLFDLYETFSSSTLTLPVPIQDEEKKIKLNFFFTLLCGASKVLWRP